ncbi:MAG: hypothetical protein QXV81_08000 [Ignisphaera sp.]|uniref:Uncharacterized protein n=1 Tax=Ignisphaera aggregans TaxID=334771 RepID=A0A7J3I5M9_9CREN
MLIINAFFIFAAMEAATISLIRMVILSSMKPSGKCSLPMLDMMKKCLYQQKSYAERNRHPRQQ